MGNKLNLNWEIVADCKKTAKNIALNTQLFIEEHTTVAVETWPEFTPVTVMVSAFTVAVTPAITKRIASDMIDLLNRHITASSLFVVPEVSNTLLTDFYCGSCTSSGEKLAGKANRTGACVR